MPKLSDEEQAAILESREFKRSSVESYICANIRHLPLEELELIQVFMQTIDEYQRRRQKRREQEKHPLAVNINAPAPIARRERPGGPWNPLKEGGLD